MASSLLSRSAGSSDPAGSADPAAELEACLDRLAEADLNRLDADGQERLLRAVVCAESRLAAFRLRVLATAESSATAARRGAASTGQWAARLANADPAAAHRQVALAQRLTARPETREALGAGSISPEHAAVIVAADRELPAAVTGEQRAVIERDLVAKARALTPRQLRRAARRSLAAVEADVAVVDAQENQLVADEEERARRATRLTLHDNDDGTVSGHFTVPTAQGHLLRKILQTITAPRRGRLGASLAQAGEPEERTDWDRARGTAFCELIEHLPTDHLHPRTAATLVVSVELETLREALAVAHLDTGEALSAGEARRLSCGSGIIPAVLGGASLPLDLGRSARLFSEAQRTALGLVHSTCAADGCERPFAWCELHHQDAWSSGGPTDIANAVPLCHFHHRRIHDHRYRHSLDDDGAVRFHRRT